LHYRRQHVEATGYPTNSLLVPKFVDKNFPDPTMTSSLASPDLTTEFIYFMAKLHLFELLLSTRYRL
jgi:hypothetical protein